MPSIFNSNFRRDFDRLTLSVVVLVMLAPVESPLLSGQVSGAANPQLVSDSNVTVPRGSYQLTCLVLDVRGNDLKAICQAINGDWLTTELHNADRCVANISNENGRLTCNRNKTGPPSAYLDAFGEGVPGLGQRLSPWAPMQAANWQLQHDNWTFKDGAPEGVRALAQTSDGFLWLGGSTGLYRFDGKQFEVFHSPFGEELLSTNITSLFALPLGGLWIGYQFGGASFLDKGRLKDYGGEFAVNSGSIIGFVQDKDGIVWAAGLSSGLWRFEHSHWEHIGMQWNVPIKNALEVALDRDGNLWAVGERMLLCLRRGSRRFQVVQDSLPFDVLHLGYAGRLMDQEGSIWLGSPKGLDRFRYSPLVKPNLPQGGGYGFALAADNDGVVLIGGWDAGLYRQAPGEMTVFRKYLDWAIAFIYRAPDTTIWLGSSSGGFGPGSGLWHESLSHQRPSRSPKESKVSFDVREALWRFTGRDWTVFDLPSEIADQGQFLQAITQDRTGGMWVSLGRHGLYRLANGVWTPYGGRHDLPTTGVVCEFTDSLGRVWFGYTRNVLAVLDGDRVQVFGPHDGLRVGNITAIHGRGSRIWIGGEFGLEQFDAGHFKNIVATNSELLRGVSGIIETANGDLWLNGLIGIFHIRQSELAEALKDPSYQVNGDHFGRRDGLPGFASQIRPLPTAIEGTDGRLWFSGSNGVVWLDPARFEHQVTPPPITVQSISADDKAYETTFPLRLPAHTSSVQINYIAVSLSNPDAIRSRYKLHETDSDWHEASKAAPITYRNLPPGSYHFSVGSTDTNGRWSDNAATVEFAILPAFYQTKWFLFLCIITAMALLYFFYLLRLRQVSQQVRGRMEASLAERERIARDLHDTLLQSVQGLVLKFHVAAKRIPAPDPARQDMEKALDYADQVMTEGRNRVRDLRSSPVPLSDLPLAFQRVADEMSSGSGTNFKTVVEGDVRKLHPVVLEESYSIGREAVVNALAHSEGLHVEVEITYDSKQFRLRIRDDGRGIDAGILKKGGRDGHWGLQGMRERAGKIGADLKLWSRPGSGTEVELTVPAKTAYRAYAGKAS
jgi:signal transduction histidine kinase/ligand-binding sensor domain-containing protein